MDEKITNSILLAQTGDILMVRTRGVFGFFIRRMLSLGLHKCYTNHNAPIFGMYPRTVQFEPPKAHLESLFKYLLRLKDSGGRYMIVRPDSYVGVRNPISDEYLESIWMSKNGTPYDKRSIRMFVRMIFRKSAKVDSNSKIKDYCTEGTLKPLLANTHIPWVPDILKYEEFPAPIHMEHLIREYRVVFVAGDKELFDQISKS